MSRGVEEEPSWRSKRKLQYSEGIDSMFVNCNRQTIRQFKISILYVHKLRLTLIYVNISSQSQESFPAGMARPKPIFLPASIGIQAAQRIQKQSSSEEEQGMKETNRIIKRSIENIAYIEVALYKLQLNGFSCLEPSQDLVSIKPVD
ncbi:hypothetical protein llap_3949 [Limosa lapponica baueri]|uniref:Uncharacterized protein n=1 Tax=Limosa lapponica baueri TaxID=1758121 RepID=A0A2I0UI65_LIMLA|nr:hypothetical protein llap_3949 [Limosa lapponica baueri]